jgi:uncharacterized protein
MTTEKADAAEVDPRRGGVSSADDGECQDSSKVSGEDAVKRSALPCPRVSEGDSPSLEVVSCDSELEFQQVDAQFVAAERLSGRIAMSVLIVGTLIAFSAWGVGLYTTRSSLWLWVVWAFCSCVGGVFLTVLGWFFHRWPVLEHRFLGWRMNEMGLEIRKGVWWQHRITVPRDRVQHTDVEQGPVMRRYGLAKLILHTAGTHAPTIELPGLKMAVAQELKSQLTDQAPRSHG